MTHRPILWLLATLALAACEPTAHDATPSPAQDASTASPQADALPHPLSLPPPGCTVGTAGCYCAAAPTPCPLGYLCDATNVCVAAPQGTEGGACWGNSTCNQIASTGQWLVCAQGICKPPACTQGSLGCGCFPGNSCSTGLLCSTTNGPPTCVLPDCAAGDEGCGCKPNLTCNTSSDGVKLVCNGTSCTRPTCSIGAKDCSCEANYGCLPGLACNTTTFKCQAITCTPGAVNCACLASGTCIGDNLYCDATTTKCQVKSCTMGALDCGCLADSSCTQKSGEPLLLCLAGKCAKATCAPGALGCGCNPDQTCGAAGLACQSGLCVKTTCATGALGCACLPSGTCAAGLLCQAGTVCVKNEGYPGGACFSNNTCLAGAKCVAGLCATCGQGTDGCGCFDNDTCIGDLVCDLGTCIQQGKLLNTKPAVPKCFTPCEQGYTRTDKTYVPCDAQGLIDGCLEGETCTDGTCLEAGEVAPTCASDINCPDFQTCLDGRCYSTCDYDSECASPSAQCYRHVCRLPCSTTGSQCSKDLFCDAADGENGFCMPVAKASTTIDVTTVEGTYDVYPSSIAFTSDVTAATIKITNGGYTPAQFTLKAITENRTTDLGSQIFCVEGSPGCLCGLDAKGGCQTSTHKCYRDESITCTSDAQCPDGVTSSVKHLCTTPPLNWVRLGSNATGGGTFTTPLLNPGESATVLISGVKNATYKQWAGTIEISHPKWGSRPLSLTYSELYTGRWSGSMYYFGSFPDKNLSTWSDKLKAWVADPKTSSRLDLESASNQLDNALIQRWSEFRAAGGGAFEGTMSLIQFKALLTSTRTGSWNFASVIQGCLDQYQVSGEIPRCYPYVDPASTTPGSGLERYTDDYLRRRVPQGLVELPVSFELKPKPNGGETTYYGRIITADTMHYAGDPEIGQFTVGKSPGALACGTAGCLNAITGFSADIDVGGWYVTDALDSGCAASIAANNPAGVFVQRSTPWLLGDFAQGTSEKNGVRYRFECRNTQRPYGLDPTVQERNLSLARANPIPDGRTLRRHIELLDGVVADASTIIVFFKEQFPSFLGGADTPTAAYGYMLLTKQDQPAQAIVNPTGATLPAAQGALKPNDVSCSQNMLEQVYGAGTKQTLSTTTAKTLALASVRGAFPAGTTTTDVTSNSGYVVAYYCGDTGLFNGGPKDYTFVGRTPVACPSGSKVTFFVLNVSGSLTWATDCPVVNAAKIAGAVLDESQCVDEWVAKRPCQSDTTEGSTHCQDTFAAWQTPTSTGAVLAAERFPMVVEPPWRCNTAGIYVCDEASRTNLRLQKTFMRPSTALAPGKNIYVPLESQIADAFRYRTKFTNRFGTGLAFTPVECGGANSSVPYCYGAQDIERVRERVDCAAAIYNGFRGSLDADTLTELRTYLRRNFSYSDQATSDGFEKLYAELLVMLGQDAVVRAAASRFDLAESATKTFEGSKFEPKGIDLAGLNGFELYNLYQSTQYFQLALDRLFRLSTSIYTGISAVQADAIIDYGTAANYLPKLVMASTEKARAWEAISQRYVNFNRPDLARQVLERAYTASYLESAILGRLYERLIASAPDSQLAQLNKIAGDSFSRYLLAMLDMREAYAKISDNRTLFGFEPDYIPFPALDPSQNAFEVVLARTKEKLQLALIKENAALSSQKSYDTDQVSFQNELTDIENNYDAQLEELCGSFTGDDGKVYPATRRYAYMNSWALQVGDPGGRMGGGAIFSANSAIAEAGDSVRSATRAIDTNLAQIAIARNAHLEMCNEDRSYAAMQIKSANWKFSMEQVIWGAQRIRAHLSETQQTVNTAASFLKCNIGLATDCVGAVAAASVVTTTTAVTTASSLLTELAEKAAQVVLWQNQNNDIKVAADSACTKGQIQTDAEVYRLMLQQSELTAGAAREVRKVDLLRQDYDEVRRKAERIFAEQEEKSAMRIDLEAAKNNPNVRIYKNDDILNAERTFDDAVREAYRLTKVYEYYTSKSYTHLGDLFFVRMVAHGSPSLENYLDDLEDAYFDFGEAYGNPDTRVEVVSARDDVLQIPRLGGGGKVLSQAERVEEFRARLADPSRLSPEGYLTLPFTVPLIDLSPLTRNHKLAWIEAEVVGADVGDTVARVYLRQAGTSTIRPLTGDLQFYRFPKRNAVVNVFFNGARVFDQSVYRNERMRDRPLVNSQWELVLNQADELANTDINLGSLSDIRLYLYYTDFTAY